jgi:hypothetical protein
MPLSLSDVSITDFHFSRIKGRPKGFVDIELDPVPESAPAVAA